MEYGLDGFGNHSARVYDQGPGQLSRYSDSLRAERSGGSNPGRRRDFPHQSRPAMWPIQLPIQWVPGLSRG
jgi:hypothetical protein